MVRPASSTFSVANHTFVEFSKDGKLANKSQAVAESRAIPLKVVLLPNEAHVYNAWGREAFLIGPDDHVAWRRPSDAQVEVHVEEVLLVAVGQRCSKYHIDSATGFNARPAVVKGNFTSTIGNADQEKVEILAVFQK